jgi:diguanylate cyclase (GGDEF)-like protein
MGENLRGALEDFLSRIELSAEDRQNLEKMIRQMDYFSLAINSRRVPMHMVDRNLRVVLANQAIKNWNASLGLSTEMEGKLLKQVYPFLTDRVFAEYEEILNTGHPLDTKDMTMVKEEEIYTETKKDPVISRGAIIGVLTEIHDITPHIYCSNHDQLTGLYSRMFFFDRIQKIVDERLFPVALVMFDVDRMKEVNDRYGHLRGDEFLRDAAAVLRSAFRADDYVCRYGGDEFIAIVPKSTSVTQRELIDRVNAGIANYNTENPEIQLSISLGCAMINGPQDLEAALRRADDLMYKEKRKNNSVCE